MAHKKAGGSTALGRDSRSQRLGIKIFGGQAARVGNIIVRQRGTKWHPGRNIRIGNDDTLYAVASGVVKFTAKKVKGFDGNLHLRKLIHIVPATAAK